MDDLKSKVVWAIGSGTGIGAAGAEALAGAGARVVLSGRRSKPLDDVAVRIREAGGEAHVDQARRQGRQHRHPVVGGGAARQRQRLRASRLR